MLQLGNAVPCFPRYIRLLPLLLYFSRLGGVVLLIQLVPFLALPRFKYQSQASDAASDHCLTLRIEPNEPPGFTPLHLYKCSSSGMQATA